MINVKNYYCIIKNAPPHHTSKKKNSCFKLVIRLANYKLITLDSEIVSSKSFLQDHTNTIIYCIESNLSRVVYNGLFKPSHKPSMNYELFPALNYTEGEYAALITLSLKKNNNCVSYTLAAHTNAHTDSEKKV